MEKFESVFARSLKQIAIEQNVKARIYRYPMTKYQMQGFDIYSDSANPGFYKAYECKSINFLEDKNLYFSQHFHHSKGVHQLEYEQQILEDSGRCGCLVVELRRDRPKNNTVAMFHFDEVYRIYKTGTKSLPKQYLLDHQMMMKTKGVYNWDEDARLME